jgi:hypothetical protein
MGRAIKIGEQIRPREGAGGRDNKLDPGGEDGRAMGGQRAMTRGLDDEVGRGRDKFGRGEDNVSGERKARTATVEKRRGALASLRPRKTIKRGRKVYH